MLVAVFEPVVGRVFHVLFLGPGAFLRLFGVALAGALQTAVGIRQRLDRKSVV